MKGVKMNNSIKLGVQKAIDKDDVTKLCRELVRIPSFSGEEGPVAQLLGARLEASGLLTRIDQHGNLIAILKGEKPGPKLMLNGHMDVAPVGRKELWEREPFGATIENDTLYGRGACDMKAALAAMTVAAGTLWPLRKSLKGDLILAFITKEERGNGTLYVLQDKSLVPDLAIIGEPTNMNIALGQRYGSWVELSVSGESVHFQLFPKIGVDAVSNMMDLLQEIRKMELPKDPRLGESDWALTMIEAEPNQFGLINDRCRVQLIVNQAEIGETLEAPSKKLIAKLQNVIDNLKKRKPDLVAEVREVNHLASFYTSPDDPRAKPLITSLRQNIEARTNRTPDLFSWSFCTDAVYFSRFFNAIAVGFGPGLEFGAHLPTDCVKLSHLIEATEVYALTALDILGI
jgi:acetylornithine deacetylase/succinyl-diaminopimelate desuccinylase-like protein